MSKPPQYTPLNWQTDWIRSQQFLNLGIFCCSPEHHIYNLFLFDFASCSIFVGQVSLPWYTKLLLTQLVCTLPFSFNQNTFRVKIDEYSQNFSKFIIRDILADRTAASSVIGYWHDTVACLSLCLSVRLWRSVLWRSGSAYRGRKWYRRVPRSAPASYSLLQTLAIIGRIVQPKYTAKFPRLKW